VRLALSRNECRQRIERTGQTVEERTGRLADDFAEVRLKQINGGTIACERNDSLRGQTSECLRWRCDDSFAATMFLDADAAQRSNDQAHHKTGAE